MRDPVVSLRSSATPDRLTSKGHVRRELNREQKRRGLQSHPVLVPLAFTTPIRWTAERERVEFRDGVALGRLLTDKAATGQRTKGISLYPTHASKRFSSKDRPVTQGEESISCDILSADKQTNKKGGAISPALTLVQGQSYRVFSMFLFSRAVGFLYSAVVVKGTRPII